MAINPRRAIRRPVSDAENIIEPAGPDDVVDRSEVDTGLPRPEEPYSTHMDTEIDTGIRPRAPDRMPSAYTGADYDYDRGAILNEFKTPTQPRRKTTADVEEPLDTEDVRQTRARTGQAALGAVTGARGGVADETDLYGTEEAAPADFGTEEERMALPYGGYPIQGLDISKSQSGSLKHTALRILSRYPHTYEGLQQAVEDPDFKRFFPNARVVDEDKIDFGGQGHEFGAEDPIGLVDVIYAVGDPASQWTWLPFEEGGGTAGGDLYGGGIPTGIEGLGQSDILAEIMRAIQELSEGQDPYLADALNNLFGKQPPVPTEETEP